MKKLLIFVISAISVYTSCSSNKENRITFEELDGLISIETESFSSNNGWKHKSHYTGEGVIPDKTEDGSPAIIEFDIKITNTGDYNVFILGNRKYNTPLEQNIFKVELLQSDELYHTTTVTFPALNAPSWSSINASSGEQIVLNVPKEGDYTLRLTDKPGKQYYIDKIVLSRNTGFKPKGTGPEATIWGRTPENNRDKIVLPPQWTFGVLYGAYTNQKQTIEVIDSIINSDFPIDAYSLDSYFWDFNKGDGPKGYIDFIGDTSAYPNMEAMWDYMKEKQIKSGIWIWNQILETGNENVFNEFNSKGFFSGTFINKNGWHNETRNTLTGSIDFDNPDAVELWKQKLEPFFNKGVDFLKLDNSSAIPFCKAAFEATQTLGKETKGRGFILAHLHSTFDNRHKLYPTKWSGDAKITWSQPDYPDLGVYAMGGYKENIHMVSNPNLTTYEIPFLAHDAGGYNFFGDGKISDELYIRWMQFASMNSIMMLFSTADNPTRNHPYRFSKEVQDNFRKYTHLRMKLFPYIYSYALNTHLTGEKMVQGDGKNINQYLFGNELLVAPVYKPGEVKRDIFLPEGEWIDFETHQIFKGNAIQTVDAPLNKLPLLVKSGAIIPMREYARSIELGSNDKLNIYIYPSEKLTSFTLLEDDGTSNDYLDGVYSSMQFSVMRKESGIVFNTSNVEGEFKGMNTERSYNLKFHLTDKPSKVIMNGTEISNKKGTSNANNWHYDGKSRTVIVAIDHSKLKPFSIELKY